MGKEEIARNEQFLLFLQCFQLYHKIVSPFVNIFDILSLFVAELEEPKGEGLMSHTVTILVSHYFSLQASFFGC